MKTTSKLALLSFALLVISCNNSTSSNGDKDSMPDSTAEQAAPNPETPAPSNQTTPAPKQPVDYSALMTEYHDIICRNYKRKAEGKPANVDDNLRLAEITNELNNISRDLNQDEKTKFTFALARANNTQSCP